MITKNYSFQVKSVDEGGKFQGYASVYGNVDTDGEVVDKGAFKRSIGISNGRVPILWAHNPSDPIGWNLSAKEDDHGLFVEGQLMLNTEKGRLAYEYAKLGNQIGGEVGLSVGFMPTKDGVYIGKDGNKHFSQCRLMEYSYCVFAANPEASVTGIKSQAILPAIVVKSNSLTHEEPELTEEQRTSLKNLKDELTSELTELQEKSASMPNETEVKSPSKEATIDPALSYEQALATHQAHSDLSDERYNIERAKDHSVDTIRNHPTMTKADKVMAIHKTMHSYADAMTGYHKKAMDLEDGIQQQTKAIKGMNTDAHASSQMALAKADFHLKEAKVQRASADDHLDKAHKITRDVVSAYKVADIEAPTPPAVPASKKADEPAIVTKSEETIDLTGLLASMAVQ